MPTPQLQFGHGLLCRGNPIIGIRTSRYPCSFNSATACYAVETTAQPPKAVLLDSFNSATACYAVETAAWQGRATAASPLQFGHGLLCRGNGVRDVRRRGAARGASIRPRLVMPWKLGLRSSTSLALEASIRPRLVMPWKHEWFMSGGRESALLQFGHGLLCRGNPSPSPDKRT